MILFETLFFAFNENFTKFQARHLKSQLFKMFSSREICL